jgi:hypothetical protein
MTNKEISTVNQIARREVSVQSPDPNEVHGDYPGVNIVHGEVIGEVEDEEEFPGLVEQYVKENPELVEAAKTSGADVVARMDKKKKVAIFTGAGAAVLVTIAGIAGLVIYKRRRRSKEE